jgi:excisionase family DNA binding protein
MVQNQGDPMTNLPNKDLFRVEEVAAYFSITERTVRLWIEHGKLEAIKKVGIVRITRENRF